MRKKRSTYFWISASILILGILSRKTTLIPLFFGDILYACLIYFGLRFLFPKPKMMVTAVIAVLFCFTIEFLQLYQDPRILSIRKTTLGHYVLGEGFLWSDLGCYTIGVGMVYLIDYCTPKIKYPQL